MAIKQQRAKRVCTFGRSVAEDAEGVASTRALRKSPDDRTETERAPMLIGDLKLSALDNAAVAGR
jgi:hypothetical protein